MSWSLQKNLELATFKQLSKIFPVMFAVHVVDVTVNTATGLQRGISYLSTGDHAIS